jgi:antibiotic biosynthesis monooxygenase (ABM) superfamily enzyme
MPMMAKPDAQYACGCGRSPTGKCIGWHALTEEAYASKLAEWTTQQDESDAIEREKMINEELEAYRQQAMDLWFDNGGSCTGAKPPQ